MRKVINSIAIGVMVALVGVSCNKRTIIPDEELAMIFKDAFLTNAYIFDNKIDFDSLRVYEPIFDSYGYSSEDIAYTVGSFSKRKSARLSDVVERAIVMLTEGQTHYRRESIILDSIDAKAQRLATRRIYHSEQVKYLHDSDTTKLELEFFELEPGKYTYSFNYKVDSTDNTRSSYRAITWVESADQPHKRNKIINIPLSKRTANRISRTMDIDTLTHKMVVKLAESYELKRTHNVEFNNIELYYTPTTDVAREQMFTSLLDIRIFADDNFAEQTTDSLQLPTP